MTNKHLERIATALEGELAIKRKQERLEIISREISILLLISDGHGLNDEQQAQLCDLVGEQNYLWKTAAHQIDHRYAQNLMA